MKIQESAQIILGQLSKCLEHLEDGIYQDNLDLLSGASIGKHVRHILDMFVCLDRATADGLVSYEKRMRNLTWENNRMSALEAIAQLQHKMLSHNRTLRLETHFLDATEGTTTSASDLPEERGIVLLETNYLREMAYCIEHAIHHMAIIKIALISVGYTYPWDDFGVAPSTARFQKVRTGS